MLVSTHGENKNLHFVDYSLCYTLSLPLIVVFATMAFLKAVNSLPKLLLQYVLNMDTFILQQKIGLHFLIPSENTMYYPHGKNFQI